MKLFVDTADVEEIRKLNDLGIIDGVTTNPSLVAKTGKKFRQVVDDTRANLETTRRPPVLSADDHHRIAGQLGPELL